MRRAIRRRSAPGQMWCAVRKCLGGGLLGCEDGTVFVTFDQAWNDQGSSWWAKANRAGEHLASLRGQIAEFRASNPYTLTPEPTDKPGRLAYRLRFSGQIPVT